MRLNRRSIILRISLLYVIVTLLNVSVFVLLVFENQLDLIADNAILSSQHTGSSLKLRIDNVLASGGGLDARNTDKIFGETSRLGVTALTLYDDSGVVLADSSANGTGAKGERAEEEVFRLINLALTKGEFEDKLFHQEVDRRQKRIELYIPFSYDLNHMAVARVQLPMKDVQKQMSYLYYQVILLTTLIVVIHALFALIVSRMLVRPLRTLTAATQEISRGLLDTRVPIVGDDEIGQLANAFNEMSVALKGIRDEAKAANPLTGLPGNTQISLELERRFGSEADFCLMYVDIDNFKAYNDGYGFSRGDDAILYTRDRLVEVAREKQLARGFIGHQGGDDFVVLCDYAVWESYAGAFITAFDGGILRFYNKTDAQNGYIESIDRLGRPQRFPLMSVSVAVATNHHRSFSHPAEMIQVVAEIKSYLKKRDGSMYKIDTRTPRTAAMLPEPEPSAVGGGEDPVSRE
jgi:GGDEF domain-containing protein